MATLDLHPDFIDDVGDAINASHIRVSIQTFWRPVLSAELKPMRDRAKLMLEPGRRFRQPSRRLPDAVQY
jgi:hypothetical protein